MPIEAGGRLYTAQKLPEIFTPEFWRCLDVWYTSRLLHGNGGVLMPFSGGWAEQPDAIIRVLVLFQRVENEIQSDKLKRE